MSSKSVDERIVDMQFNNQQFESGIKTSLSSLDKLKRSLDFKKESKAFDGLSNSTKNFSLSNISSGVDMIAGKFSALGVIGVTALQNITNSAINAGKRIVAALTIDPINQGFSEYELKMGSVQTIMASTGESLATVNKYLEDLNVYADRTIYSFADMTANIGKFTNAGVSLKDSVAAIQGVSNVAAVSGANANEASRAMYNFAQALSAGYVKLIDWKSIENANMATVEFKNYLLEAAVAAGTLTRAGDGMYKTLKGNLVSATKNFNDTLQDQWMTNKVLVKTLGDYADETTEIGKKAFAAAQDVKTLSQLFDTLKEAAGSGWAQTWELVIGDFDEAKVVLTELNGVLGGLIDRMSDGRNELLKVWKANGGRDAMIQSLRNVFSAIGAIAKPVREAFRDIFPPMTGDRLVAMTKALADFTAKLKIGDETSSKIRSTFKGLFSILSIGWNFLVNLTRGVRDLVKALSPAGKGLLGFSGSIGDWLQNVDKGIKKGDTFAKMFQKLRDTLTTVSNGVKSAFDTMRNAIREFTGVDLSSVDTFITTIKDKFHPLQAIGSGVKKAFGFIATVFKQAGPAISNFAKTVSKAIGSGGLNGLMQLFATGAFAGMAIAVKNVADSIAGFLGSTKKVTAKAGEFVKAIKEILGGVKDALKAYEDEKKAGVLLKTAGAIAILAGALYLLSMIDAGKLGGALTAITVLFGELFGSMAIFEKTLSSKGFKSIGKVTLAMLPLSVAILLLAHAVSELAKNDWDGLTKGLIGVAALMSMLIAASVVMSKVSGNVGKASLGLLIFAVAIRAMVSSVVALGKIDIDKLIQGMVALLGVLAMLAGFMIATKTSGLGASDAAGLIAVAIAVRIIASAIKTLSKIDPDSITDALVAIGFILTEIAIFTKFVGNGKGLASTATGLIILGVAMMVFAKAIEKLGSLPVDVLFLGLLGLSLALAAVTVALNFMPKNMLAVGVGLLAVSAGLLLMANAIKMIGGMTWEEMGRGLLALGGALLIVSIAVNAMKGALGGAAAMLVVGAALIGMSIALKILGSMPLAGIAKSLLAIVGVLLIFGGAAALLTPVIPMMMALAASLLLLSVGLIAVGASAILLGLGLSMISGAGWQSIAMMLALVAALIPLTFLAPQIAILGGALIVLSLGLLAVGGSIAAVAAGMVALVAVGPAGMDALLKLANTAAQMAEFAVQLLAAGGSLLVFGLGAIVAGAGALVAGVGIMVLAAGLEQLSKIDMTNLSGMESLAVNLLKAAGALLLASPGLLAGGAALVVFGSGAQSTGEGLEAINRSITEVVEAVKNVPADIKAATDAITASMETLVSDITTALLRQTPKVEETTKDLMNASVKTILGTRLLFVTSGVQLVDGFITGIKSRISAAASMAAFMARSSLDAVNNVLKIRSPSRAFGESGKNSVLGFAKGLKDYTYLAVNAAESVSRNTLQPVLTMSDNFLAGSSRMGQGIQKMTNAAMSMHPTVTSERTQIVKHTFDTLHVEGVNDDGEFIAAADYSVEEMLTSMMRRQNRV